MGFRSRRDLLLVGGAIFVSPLVAVAALVGGSEIVGRVFEWAVGMSALRVADDCITSEEWHLAFRVQAGCMAVAYCASGLVLGKIKSRLSWYAAVLIGNPISIGIGFWIYDSFFFLRTIYVANQEIAGLAWFCAPLSALVGVSLARFSANAQIARQALRSQ